MKTHQQWLGFLVMLLFLFYAYTTVLFEPHELVLDIVYGLLFILLIMGLLQQFFTEIDSMKKIKFNSLDGLFVIFGVFISYIMNHFLGLNVVMASSITGIFGFIFIRKYEIPIYCGSFAGMVSVSLFGFLEVSVLAVICAFIFIVTKPLFSGFGGKLGTIAFMSSLIVHSIFNDEFITVSTNLNDYLTLLTTVSAVLITFYSKKYLKLTAVAASAIPSLIIAMIFILFIPSHIDYIVVFFSASFIGMSSSKRLPSFVYVLLSGIILGLVYDFFIEFFNGLGGKLGLMAMISVIITSGIFYIINKLMKKGGVQE